MLSPVFSSVSPFPISSRHAQASSCSSLCLADSALPPGSALLTLLSPPLPRPSLWRCRGFLLEVGLPHSYLFTLRCESSALWKC